MFTREVPSVHLSIDDVGESFKMLSINHMRGGG
jgi:hypothetical protein